MATLTAVTQVRRPGIDQPSFSTKKVSKKPKYRFVLKNSVSSTIFSSARGSLKEVIRRRNEKTAVSLVGAGWFLSTVMETPVLSAELYSIEPSNALSLPTWVIHISCVIEWITAMALSWEYGEKSGNESWKGLSWGMVPLLGGALCCCTWHFFYNSESLEVLVTLQGALTVIGNATLCLAAFRIYSSSQENSEKL